MSCSKNVGSAHYIKPKNPKRREDAATMDAEPTHLPLSARIRELLNDPHVQSLVRQRFFYWVEERAAGGRRDWPGVSKEVEAATGVSIPVSTLRQFIPPKPRDEAGERRSLGPQERWEALYAVVEGADLMHEVELEAVTESAPGLAVLHHFMKCHDDAPVPEGFSGRFVSWWSDPYPEDVPQLILSIQDPPGNGMVRAQLYEDFDPDSDEATAHRASFSGALLHHVQFCLVLVFNRLTGEPRSLTVLQTEPSMHNADQPINALAVGYYAEIASNALNVAFEYREGDLSEAGTLELATFEFEDPRSHLLLTRH